LGFMGFGRVLGLVSGIRVLCAFLWPLELPEQTVSESLYSLGAWGAGGDVDQGLGLRAYREVRG